MAPSNENRPADPARLSPIAPENPPVNTEARIADGLLKLSAAALIFVIAAQVPEPGPLTTLGQLIAVALMLDGLLVLGPPSIYRLLSTGALALLLLLFALALADRSLNLPWSPHRALLLSLALALAGGASGHLLHLRRRWRQRRPAWRGIQQSQRPTPVRAAIPARRLERRSLDYRHSSRLNLLLWLLLWPLALLALILTPVPLLNPSYFFAPEMRELARNWLVIFGLMLLMVLPALAAGWRRRVWRRCHCGYDAADDYFYLTEGATTLARWPAADFIGIYWEGTGAGVYRVGAQLWLAGAQGRDDVALAELNYWYRSNEAAAARLAARLSTASGLPVLYRADVEV